MVQLTFLVAWLSVVAVVAVTVLIMLLVPVAGIDRARAHHPSDRPDRGGG